MKSLVYRGRAEYCLSMLEIVSSVEAKNNLASMAECWHRLAHEADEREQREHCGKELGADDPVAWLSRSRP
jgi:hypothetical protein